MSELTEVAVTFQGITGEIHRLNLLLQCWQVGEALDKLPTDETVEIRAAMLSLVQSISSH